VCAASSPTEPLNTLGPSRIKRVMRLSRDRCLEDIEALYRSRFPYFLRIATVVAGDEERAREAVQDAFADVIRSRSTFRGEGPVEAWVWRAVLNRARKATWASPPQPYEDEVAQPVNGDRELELGDLVGLIALLPERQRLAVFLRYYADLDYRAIAAALDVEVGTVSATLSAAHRTLRRALREVPG
jgi:RNA polymerase sigma-70 factor (ECF subfamily)